jgi:hypothetical protein
VPYSICRNISSIFNEAEVLMMLNILVFIQ